MSTAAILKGKDAKIKVRLHNMRWPRAGHQSGDMAIVIFDVVRVLEGEIPDECRTSSGIYKYQITAKGRMPKLDTYNDYVLTGTLEIDKEWGPQYKVIQVRLDYDLSRPADMKKFFSYFMTERQIDSLLETGENPVDWLENKNIGKLTSIKGIGPVTAMRMIQRYEDCKDNGRAYVVLKSYELTKNAIDKLIKTYGSADVAVDKIETNPYVLIKEVRGYGWVKADEIALKQGFTRDCKERVCAYTQYYLEEQAESNGNSWVTVEDLLTNVAAECHPVTKENLMAWVKEMMIFEDDFDKYYQAYSLGNPPKPLNEMPLLFYSPKDRRTGLLSIRLMEREIARHIQRLTEGKSNFVYNKAVCNRLIKQAEAEQGFEYTDEQIKSIWSILENNVMVLTGSAGCVDCDTEFFNGIQWKRISDYQEGEQVLQYNEDGTTILVTPEAYVKYPAENLWNVVTPELDMCLSDEHNVYYLTKRNKLTHTSLAKVKGQHETSLEGFQGKFITGFISSGTGIHLSNTKMEIMLVIFYKGKFFKKEDGRWSKIVLSDGCEKTELKILFKTAHISYVEYEGSKPGTTEYYFYAPDGDKYFTDRWYNCSQDQLQFICSRTLFWGSNINEEKPILSSSSKNNIDFLQFAFAACGHNAVITKQDKKYILTVGPEANVKLGSSEENKFVSYKTLDGYKYCFTVPTHMWVMRRNGKIVITGNTGKTSTLSAVTKIFEHYNQSVEQCALSGRASSLLSEVTKVSGKTIHRLLGYIPDQERFAFSESNPLHTDVIILDETSMVGGELFLCLIRAIRTGSKFIMVGDTKQLESIGYANILKDCLSSGYVPAIELTKIHRQAARSGIISQSLRASSGESLIRNDFYGEEIRGELKDFKIIAASQPELVQYNIIKEFRKLFIDSKIPLEDIQIIVPTRTRGNTSCRALNEVIQSIANPNKSIKDQYVEYIDNGMKYTVCYRPGDRIIITRNDYHAMGIDKKEKQIFNGNVGYIIDINPENMVVRLQQQGDIIISRDSWGGVQLAYAITVHKKQGDSIPYAIVGLDTSSYALFSKELVYTAITRASKYCIFVTQPRAINTAVKISRVRIKQTWLKVDLNRLYLQKVEKEGWNE